MSDRELLDRVGSWLSSERVSRWQAWMRDHRLTIEAVVAGLVLVLSLPSAITGGWALAPLCVILLSSTFVLYHALPSAGLVAAGLGAGGIIAAGWWWDSASLTLAIVATVLAFFGAAAYGRAVTRWGALVAAFVAAIVGYFVVGPGGGLLVAAPVLVTLALAWVVGMLVAVNRGRTIARTGEVIATANLSVARREASIEHERNRVARDVHDIVAHSLAVVIAQADGARYAAKDSPAPVIEALETIASTARGALTDVRVLLGELRHSQEAGPQPGVDDLDALVRGFRDSGLTVQWHSYGRAAELTDALALAVYRIVQEALTNALRHGDLDEPVELVFDWGASSLTLIVINAVDGDAAQPGDEGHGIPGMRERAALAGGELDAGDGTNGRFRVRAILPLHRDDAPVSA